MNEASGVKSNLSRQQKTGFVLLVVFGILTIGLGFLQMRNTIYSPFVVRPRQRAAAAHAFLDDTTRLQQIDTDRDGLTDFDEIEFYQTSPYLPDTDSDGFTDAEEVQNGTNPLCVEGADCAVVAPPPPDDAVVSSPISNTANDSLELLGTVSGVLNGEAAVSTAVPGAADADISTLINDPAILRQLLLATGQFTEQQINQLDDETLLNLAREIAAETTETSAQDGQ